MLSFAGAHTEALGQNGMNGADYIFVVPDVVCQNMTPYYSMLVMQLNQRAPGGLQEQFENYYYRSRGLLTAADMEVGVIPAFVGVYLLYFAATYLGFKQNISGE